MRTQLRVRRDPPQQTGGAISHTENGCCRDVELNGSCG